MGRALGANAVMAMAFESAYGVAPGAGYRKIAFVSANLGDEQGLIESDLLGMGREPQEPSEDVINNRGDVVVPVDLRLFGLWLKLALGAPTTSQGVAATGSFTFSDQPDANATITVGGQAFTFVSGAPSANQIRIGANLAETLENAVLALNASAVAGVAAASYGLDLAGTKIEIVHDTLGTAGNSFAILAGSSPASNATPSGATLSGGAATGPRNHVFLSGAASLPSASIEVGHPEIPSFGMNRGVMLNTVAVQMQRSGHLNATLGLIAQAEARAPATAVGTPTEMVIERFSQWSGQVKRDGVPLGYLNTAQLTISNGLDVDESIRPDGRIGGADGAAFTVTGQCGVRYANDRLRQIAESGEGVELEFSWALGAGKSLRITVHRARLPRAKHPVTNAGGVQADYAWQGARHPTLGRSLTAVLVNDVVSY